MAGAIIAGLGAAVIVPLGYVYVGVTLLLRFQVERFFSVIQDSDSERWRGL